MKKNENPVLKNLVKKINTVRKELDDNNIKDKKSRDFLMCREVAKLL